MGKHSLNSHFFFSQCRSSNASEASGEVSSFLSPLSSPQGHRPATSVPALQTHFSRLGADAPAFLEPRCLTWPSCLTFDEDHAKDNDFEKQDQGHSKAEMLPGLVLGFMSPFALEGKQVSLLLLLPGIYTLLLRWLNVLSDQLGEITISLVIFCVPY